MDGSYLHIKNLVVNFKTFEGKTEVLNIDDFQIQKGEAYGIVGESGTGKTILAYSIFRLLAMPPGEIASGEIWLDGENLLTLSARDMRERIRGKKIAMIFQDPMSTLNPVFTVEQQMTNVIQQNQGIKGKAVVSACVALLNKVKLPDPERVLKKYPHELSGGQRQRVTIALALACKSDFIIADEPTRNLDVTIQAGILKLLHELRKETGLTLLYIANNPGLIYSTCDQAAILYKGMILEKGTTEEVLKNPKHPYTHMLLNAIPKDKSERIDLSKIKAEGKGEGDQGCRFYNRCLQKQDACKLPQVFRLIEGTHHVRCRLFEEGE